jgi:hypothetical protein
LCKKYIWTCEPGLDTAEIPCLSKDEGRDDGDDRRRKWRLDPIAESDNGRTDSTKFFTESA